MPWRASTWMAAWRRRAPAIGTASAGAGGMGGWWWSGGRRPGCQGRAGYSSSRVRARSSRRARRSAAESTIDRSIAWRRANASSRWTWSASLRVGDRPDALRSGNVMALPRAGGRPQTICGVQSGQGWVGSGGDTRGSSAVGGSWRPGGLRSAGRSGSVGVGLILPRGCDSETERTAGRADAHVRPNASDVESLANRRRTDSHARGVGGARARRRGFDRDQPSVPAQPDHPDRGPQPAGRSVAAGQPVSRSATTHRRYATSWR